MSLAIASIMTEKETFYPILYSNFDLVLYSLIRIYKKIHVSRDSMKIIRNTVMRIPHGRNVPIDWQHSTISAITYDITDGSVIIQRKISYYVLPWQVERSVGHFSSTQPYYCQTYAVQSSRLLDVYIQMNQVRIINEIIIDKRFFDQSKS